MNLRHFLGPLVTAALVLALMSNGAVGQQKSIKDQLVGSWYLVTNQQTLPDGTKRSIYGTNPKGINIFTPDGRFVVLFTRGDLPKIAGTDRAKATADEAKAIVAGSIGYFGTYTVDETAKIITYRTEGTTLANQSVEQKRIITVLTAKELSYRNPAATTGAQVDVVLRRAE
jgi:hypothetical protein